MKVKLTLHADNNTDKEVIAIAHETGLGIVDFIRNAIQVYFFLLKAVKVGKHVYIGNLQDPSHFEQLLVPGSEGFSNNAFFTGDN